MTTQSIFQKIRREIKKPFQHGLYSLYYRTLYYMCRVLLPEGLLKDRWCLQCLYRERLGRTLSLENPQTFTEKIQWLKLYDRNPSHTLKADKYSVREFVKQTIGEQHLVNLLGVYDRAEDVDFDALPRQFVLKGTHGSGMNIISPDKSLLNRDKAIKKLNYWLSVNWYKSKREWVYKNITPRIVCEEFLESNTEWGLLDYRIFCFNGKPTYIQVDYHGAQGQTRNFYDIRWNRIPLTSYFPSNPQEEPPPPCLDEMLRLASSLAKDIIFARIDFYYHNGNVLFGEITFYPSAGFTHFDPIEADYEWGKQLKLPFELNADNGNNKP